MSEQNDIQQLSDRMQSMEALLKMLVVNSITDELADTYLSGKDIGAELPDELDQMLDGAGFKYISSEENNGFDIVYIEAVNNVNYELTDFLDINSVFQTEYALIPVFVFDKLNGNRRKRFIQEKISFIVRNSEIHIASRRKRS